MLLLLGCTDADPLIVHEVTAAEPLITSATAECQTEATGYATWSFVIKTDAWTGNGKIIFSADGAYTEVHPIYSAESGSGGGWDRLEAELTVVADRDDVSAGYSTWFNCQQPKLAGILQVLTRDGEDVSDCRTFLAVDPSVWDTSAWAYTCDIPL